MPMQEKAQIEQVQENGTNNVELEIQDEDN